MSIDGYLRIYGLIGELFQLLFRQKSRAWTQTGASGAAGLIAPNCAELAVNKYV